MTYGVRRARAKLAVAQGAVGFPVVSRVPSPHATVAAKMGVLGELFCHPFDRFAGSGLTLAAAIVPLPATQLPFTQISAPVGTFPSPTEFPPEFNNAEE